MEQKLQAIRTELPRVWDALSRCLEGLEEEKARCLKTVYAGLSVHDLTALPPETFLGYVQASLDARRALPYAGTLPEELFFQYVLPPRVNNEFLDGSRSWLYSQLAQRVRDKSMTDAALEVNFWCYERATYLPTDDRTLAPLGMCRRTRGRCGEESTLLVSALRAVCIPARQCYAPYWAHCDDNHAWVEFWADGQWHYMGACEPEPEPDAGWFPSAASQAMLVRSRVPDFRAEDGFTVVNSTGRYADTVLLQVRVTSGGTPLPGAEVRFQLVNYSQLQTIHRAVTGPDGMASLETGLGCLIVSACLDGRLTERWVDVRKTREMELRREDGFDPLTQERTDRWELTPPRERIPAAPSENQAHEARLRRCEALRAAYEAGFAPETDRWLHLARGNQAEIQRFLALPAYDPEDKALLLSTLAEKDFADVTCETLERFLAAALPWKGQFSTECWRDELLAPRVEHEMLLPIRQELQAMLAGEHLSNGQDVLDWMDSHLRRVPDHGLANRRGSAAGYVRHGVCPAAEWDILAVQICRALGIPARLCPVTGRFLPPREQDTPMVCLTLATTEPELREEEHFTLARWEGNDYRVLTLGGLTVPGSVRLSLQPGAYSLITCRRQIDGTASALVRRFLLTGNRTLDLTLAPDRTAEKLQSVHLPVPDGAPSELTGPSKTGALLLFLQPGAEPTEHLLQELLELRDACNRGGWPIRLAISRQEDRNNTTLGRVLAALPQSACYVCPSGSRFALQHAMGLGDSRLPLAIALDSRGRGLWAFANYNIRTAHTLLRIVQLAGAESHPLPAASDSKSASKTDIHIN